MNAADVVKAIRIEPGTLVVFGDLELNADPDVDHAMFLALIEKLREVVGHDQWLALRLHEGATVGSYSLKQVLAALTGVATTQEGNPDAQPDRHSDSDADHAGATP